MVEMTAPLEYSTVNRCVYGGTFGDFKWPYNVPDSAFGPWSPLCTSEILNPTAPCQPVAPGKPTNFKELAFLFSNVLLSVSTLDPEIPPEGNSGDPDWMDPRLVIITEWLKLDWVKTLDDFSSALNEGIGHYLYAILHEAVSRQNYVYFNGYPELQDALKFVHEALKEGSWAALTDRIKKIAKLIVTHGKNKEFLTLQLNVHITSDLDNRWVAENNLLATKAKDLSLVRALDLVGLNLTLTETLKQYSTTPSVLQFFISKSNCLNSTNYTLQYGGNNYTVRNTTDFANLAKKVFGT